MFDVNMDDFTSSFDTADDATTAKAAGGNDCLGRGAKGDGEEDVMGMWEGEEEKEGQGKNDDREKKALGSLWVRRQVFEHSLAVPLLGPRMAKCVDFPRLAMALSSVSVCEKLGDGFDEDSRVLAVGFEEWCDCARKCGGLESKELALALVEALETNAPEAFAVVNGRSSYKSGRIEAHNLLIPVAELIAFLRLHAAPEGASLYMDPVNIAYPEHEKQQQNSQRRTSPTMPTTPTSPASGPAMMNIIMNSDGGSVLLSPPSDGGSGSSSSSSSGGFSAQENQVGVPPSSPSSSASSGKSQGKREKLPHVKLASYQHSLERETHMVVSNLPLIIESIAAIYGILAINEEKVEDLRIPAYVFEHLSFLLTTALSPSGKPTPISSVIPQWRGARDTTVPLRLLVEIACDALAGDSAATAHLPIDLYEVTRVKHNTILRVSVPPIVPDKRSIEVTATSTEMQIEANAEQEQVAEQRRFSRSSVARRRDVRIVDCRDSHFYWALTLGRVSFVDCSDCIVFVGACESLALINCKRMRVHAVTRQARYVHSLDVTSYLITRYRPHILGFSRGLNFAPYNAIYKFFDRDVSECGLGDAVRKNRWNEYFRPIWKLDDKDAHHLAEAMGTAVVGSSVAPDDEEPEDFEKRGIAFKLTPNKFKPFAVPIDSADRAFSSQSDSHHVDDGVVRVNGILPPEYKAVLVDRRTLVSNLKSEIRDADIKLRQSMLAGKSTASKENTGDADDARDERTNSTLELSEKPTEEEVLQASQEVEQGTKERGILTTIVEEKFRQWLLFSGNYGQISELGVRDPAWDEDSLDGMTVI